jgi:predicted KAP-like P-loop ATPase
MDIKLSSDYPIHSCSEDRFQRYNFSKRIAQTIADRQSQDCIVIGIYGVWGEGKTSVLNFIETELKEKEDKIIVIKFNPWRYPDENQLLIQFFHQLASVLKAKLKTGAENLGALLSRYGKLANFPLIGDFSGAVEAVGKTLDDVDAETLKQRIGEIIMENNKRIVVIIDDIDRLDKSEIHSLFRLVKLTGDFMNMVYLLSFDEQMVAAAIGERYGEGDRIAGQNFLEKIIQVPLRIPMAQPEALKEYCLALINPILETQSMNPTESDVNRFLNGFTDAILVRLITPRLAIRFSNTLSFALPLLKGEVNFVDLMLIEAVKVFYPAHYEFVSLNPSYFVETYSKDSIMINRDEKVKEIKEHFQRLGRDLDSKHSSGIKGLLIELFPRLKEAFSNTIFPNDEANRWYNEKRIVAPEYFSRYFSYTVIKGDVSDVTLSAVLDCFPSQTAQQQVEALNTLITNGSAENLIRKLRSTEEQIPWPLAKPLAKGLAQLTDLFQPEQYQGFFESMSPFGQSAIFTSRLIKHHTNKSEALEFAIELLKESLFIEYAFEIRKWFLHESKVHDEIFTDEENDVLSDILLERCKTEAGEVPLHKFFPNFAYILYKMWSKKDHEDLQIYFRDLTTKDPNAYLEILFWQYLRSSMTGEIPKHKEGVRGIKKWN